MQDNDRLRLFLHLAESLNFGRTSSERHVSAATLTRTIQRLESEVGARLFDRGPHGVALTDDGRRFRDYAQSALELWTRFQAGETPRGLTGRLSLFSSVTACLALVPDLLGRFRAAHPEVEFDLQTGDAVSAIARLDEGAVDLAVAALPARLPSQLLSRPIATTPLVFIAQSGVDTLGEVFVLPRSGLARAAADRWFRQHRVRPRAVTEVDGHEALLALVALGSGVGVVPQLVLDSSVVRNRLTVLDVEPQLEPFTIGVCVRQADLRRPVIAAFWAQ